ncbi:MAG: phosphatase PAP2 family protein [Halolamina sp.]
MTVLLSVLVQVVVVVVALHLLSLRAIDGVWTPFSYRQMIQQNARIVAPTAVVLGGLLGANSLIRDIGVELSWLIGINITGAIHALEGGFVAELQSLATPGATAYFSFIYVFGYVFLLTFPLVLYAIHAEPEPLSATLLTYILNYGIGLVCYIIFVTYGPRNFMPEAVNSLLFTSWPRSQLLTSQVNVNTNVFPSLHTSLSASVAFLAYYYRSVSPRWLPVASIGAVSVAISTMYLGIHWLTDVVAGVLLAAGCVALSIRLATNEQGEPVPLLDADAGSRGRELLRR